MSICATDTKSRSSTVTASRTSTNVCGALYLRTAPAANACRTHGRMGTFDIVFVGRRLTVRHNNQKILDNIDVGPKGTGFSSEREDAPGPFRLQGDHGQMSFRNVKIRPLSKQEGEKLLA